MAGSTGPSHWTDGPEPREPPGGVKHPVAGGVNRYSTDEGSISAHYNFSLGLAYAPRGGSLSRKLVLACRRDYVCPPDYSGRDWVSAGVDVGRVLHVRISRWPAETGKAIPLFLGEVEGFSELASLWDRYGVNCGVIDERPEERAAREFARRFPGRVYLARWSGQGQHEDVALDAARDLVIARRAWSLDQTVDAFITQRRLLPKTLPHDYVRHLTAPHKVIEKTKDGQKWARYVNDGKADHYFFAETYDLLAHHQRRPPAAGAWGQPPGAGSHERVKPPRRASGPEMSHANDPPAVFETAALAQTRRPYRRRCRGRWRVHSRTFNARASS